MACQAFHVCKLIVTQLLSNQSSFWTLLVTPTGFSCYHSYIYIAIDAIATNLI